MQSPKRSPRFSDALPELHRKVTDMFVNIGDLRLMEQVNNLRIFALCDCNDADCGAFWTIEPPADDDSADLDVRGFGLPNVEGVAVEVIEGQIGFVEILPSAFGREVRATLRKALGAE